MFNTDTLTHLASIRPDALHYFIGRLAVMAQTNDDLMQSLNTALTDTQDYIASA